MAPTTTPLLLLYFLTIANILPSASPSSATSYGVDVSFPIHHSGAISTNYAWLPHNADPVNNPVTPAEYVGMPVQPLPGRTEFYEEYLRGCRKHYGKFKAYNMCTFREVIRTRSGFEQVTNMKNFTANGFHKMKVPPKLYERILHYWNKNRANMTPELDSEALINFWVNKPQMVDVGDNEDLHESIFDVTQPILEEWMGLELEHYSVYGISVYGEGNILIPHVDDLPRVASAIINVDQDVDEDWPLEVIGHDGIAYNITMQPGDMVLYEGHSTYQGRPFELKGRYYANIFVHFYPNGYALDETPIHNDIFEGHDDVPIYITGGKWKVDDEGMWEMRFRKDEDEETKKQQVIYANEGADGETSETYDEEDEEEVELDMDNSQTEAHHHAFKGDIDALHEVASNESKRHMLLLPDANGWQPLHEAVRMGHENVVNFLLDHGADINARVAPDQLGVSPLVIALDSYDVDNNFITFLEEKGAVIVEPDDEL